MTALTLAIVALCALAFVRTQVLKGEEPPVSGIEIDERLSPGCDCPRQTAKLAFTLEAPQTVSATIVDEDGEPVRALLDAARRDSGRERLRWDGTDDAGRVVPDGEYRLSLDLTVPERTIVIPTDLVVDAHPAADDRSAARAERSPG